MNESGRGQEREHETEILDKKESFPEEEVTQGNGKVVSAEGSTRMCEVESKHMGNSKCR